MPMRAPRLCKCGHRIASGVMCPCERRADAERRARFEKTRPNSSARGYDRKWEEARKAFLREHRWCRRCGKPAALVDHEIPHKGDLALFWNRGNWQSLCTPCHSSSKQREERRLNDGVLDMTAFAAAGAKLFIGDPADPASADFGRQTWAPIARLESLGSARFASGLEVTSRLDDLDVGQGILRGAAVLKASRAFRATFPDGSERLFVARIMSARERTGRLRVVLMVLGEVRSTSARILAVAS